MPQVVVEYSAGLAEAFDRKGFALALHTEGAPIIEAEPAKFKTRFYPMDDVVIGDDSGDLMTHLSIGILSGREPEAKQRLAVTAMELLDQHLTPQAGVKVRLTVEVYDMDKATYQQRSLG